MLATVRARLILLTLIVAIPLVAANLFLIGRLTAEQSTAQRESLVATTRALAAAVDAELKTYIVVGYALRTSVLLELANFERFHRQASEAVSELPGAWVVVADVEGQQLVNTLKTYGDMLPSVAPLDVHQQVLRTGAYQVGDVAIGPVAQRFALGIFLPVFIKGKAEYDIVIGLPL